MIFKKIILITFLILSSCDLPTEQISYNRKPVVFGYIDAGFNRIEPIYLFWSENFSTPHTGEASYIQNATITLTSTYNDEPEYNINMIYNSDENGYVPDQNDITNDFQIKPESVWTLNIQFSDGDKNHTLIASTEVPKAINLSSTNSEIPWNCNGQPVDINSNFNLYKNENEIDSDGNGTPDLIQDWLDTGDLSFLNGLQVDEITYNNAECYTSSFASVPYFTIDLQTDDENVVARYLTIALETDKDMNEDGINIPYESAIFDTTLSANAFKGPMNYSQINYSEDYGISNPPYEWGWHRDPIDRINLTGNIIDVMWLFFDYYGINIMIVQPMGEDYKKYYESDPDQFSFPYVLRQTNINSDQDDAYGLFYSTNSQFFFFDVKKEQNNY